MKALHVTSYGLAPENFTVATVPKPEPKPDQLVVRVKATALNPVDVYLCLGVFKPSPLPLLLGCDLAGVVDSVGSAVTGFKPGDRVGGYTKVMNEFGTFAEYAVIPASHAFRMPDSLSFEDAATVGVGAYTALLGLSTQPKLPLPSQRARAPPAEKEALLVWGASGSVGSMAVQLARIGGYEVIGVASPGNFDLVKRLGATHVVDRAAPDAVEQIKKLSGGRLRLMYDAVASEETVAAAARLLDGVAGAQLSVVLPPKNPLPANITVHNIYAMGTDDFTAESNEVTALLASSKCSPFFHLGFIFISFFFWNYREVKVWSPFFLQI